MIDLTGYGVSARLPTGWEGRVYRRPTPGAAQAAAADAGANQTATGWLGDQTLPVMHLAKFALPADRGDFGSGAVELMGPTNVFLALLDYGPACLGGALFSSAGIPRPNPQLFDPNGLQRQLPGQAGYQAFFTEAGRPMCLYVVIGSVRSAGTLCPQVDLVLDGVAVEAPR
jgi:hypothetical protein